MIYFINTVHVDVNVHMDRLPIPESFKQTWTNERFYDYFDITKKEQKIIEDWAKEIGIK